jgi:hypothetical protein
MKPMNVGVLAFFSCLLWSTVFADVQSNDAPDPLFASDDILNVRFVAAFDDIMLDRDSTDYVAGKFQFKAENGESIELDVGVRARGHFRRRRDICLFPPLQLNFKKPQTVDTLFSGQNKLKLVTHCQPRSYVYEQAVLSEYLAYRIFNLLTDTSFRVRLLRIEYANTDDDEGSSDYAFFIEHKNRIGDRLGMQALDIETTTIANIEPEFLNLSSVYQYLIGNTDFSPITGPDGENCCHNYTLFTTEDGTHYSIPYDFDQAGIVNAPHAAPNPKLHLSSVQERLYRGRCVNNALLNETFDKFIGKRATIEALISEQEGLSSSTRKDIRKYISSFFRTISSERAVNRNIIKRCE